MPLPTVRQIDDAYAAAPRVTRDGAPRGRFVLWDVDEVTGVWTPRTCGENAYLYTGGYIAARAVGLGDVSFKVGTMYVEYYNAVAPGDLVSVPTVSRTDKVAYYSGLASPGDYLRLPMTFQPVVSISPGYEAYYDPALGEGNRLTFYAQTTGSVGVLGRTFSDTVNSTVIGVGLVATPTPADRTKDYLLARGYLSTAPNRQKLKLPNSQIGVTWQFDWL